MIKIKLKELLKERNMTLNELSQITGISAKTLSLFQNQKTESVHYKTLEKICITLNIKIQDIIEVVSEEEQVEVDKLEVFISLSDDNGPHDILKVPFKQILSCRKLDNKYEYRIELKNGNVVTKTFIKPPTTINQNIIYDYRKNVKSYYA